MVLYFNKFSVQFRSRIHDSTALIYKLGADLPEPKRPPLCLALDDFLQLKTVEAGGFHVGSGLCADLLELSVFFLLLIFALPFILVNIVM